MAAPKPNPRISIDYRFCAPPFALVTDSRLSAQALRLWCILYMLDYQHIDPEITTLVEHMRQGDTPPTRRSVYRWLGELVEAGWLEWHKSPGKSGALDRFVLVTRPAQPVTYMSQVDPPDMQPVTPESQPVTPESQVVTYMSQVEPDYALPERMDAPPKSHESYREHDDGGCARTLLRSVGLYPGSINQILALDIDYQTLHASIETLLAAGWGAGAIATELRQHPPEKGKPYDIPEQRSAPTKDYSRRPAKARASHAPSGGAELRDPGWMDREIARAEQYARDHGLS